MLQLSELPALTDGRWLRQPEKNLPVSGAHFDTRKLQNETLFFAWAGEQADGHSYLSRLNGTAVKAAIVEKDAPVPEGIAVLLVENSLHALWSLASEARRRFKGQVIAVTGSSGKTTFKAWLAEILGNFAPVCFSGGSFNNHIGCPITALGLNSQHKFLVLEMGTNNPGEIATLSNMLRPDIAAILNVGHAHVGHFGSIAATRKAKAEIVDGLTDGGVIFLPSRDDAVAEAVKKNIADRLISVRFFPEHICTSEPISPLEQEATLELNERRHSFRTTALGSYAAKNFSLIASIVELLGYSPEKAIPAFSRLKNPDGRMSATSVGGSWVIDDAYNANPESLAHLLELMSTWRGTSKTLVLGDLAELGNNHASAANIIAPALKDQSIEVLCLGGGSAEKICEAVKLQKPFNFQLMPSRESILDRCLSRTEQGAIIAFKGSNSSKFSPLAQQLIKTLKEKTS